MPSNLVSTKGNAHANINNMPLPWITLCLCKCGTQYIISENSVKYHAEMRASTLIDPKKNTPINFTIIRVRYYFGNWSYSLSSPCTHCFKVLCQRENQWRKKYGKKVKINVRWSITGQDLELTPYININDLEEHRLSKGWAFKLDRFNQIPASRCTKITD